MAGSLGHARDWPDKRASLQPRHWEARACAGWRGQKLAVPEVHQGVDDKLAVLTTLASKYGLTLDQVAYIGDDVNDLEALRVVGFSAARSRRARPRRS